jgi:two-component system sensor histidine kinase MprB
MSNVWTGLHYRRSLASRVTLLSTLAVGFAVSIVAFAAYATVRAQTLSTLDDSLLDRASAAAQSNALDLLSQEVPSWALGAADVKIIFVTANPPRARSADTTDTFGIGRLEFDVARGSLPYSTRTAYYRGERWRVVAVPAADGRALVLAQSMAPTDRMLDRLGLVMLLFGVAGMIAAGFAGWAVARNGLRPVRRLTTAVEDIARTQRLDPIRIEGSDEVARLAASFNEMLRALSAAQHRQRQLVADAGHELRTPLTSLRTNLDLLSQSDSQGGGLPPEARAELLDDVRAQIEELTTLIGDLVELARDEPLTRVVEAVDLPEVVDHAVGRVRRRAPGVTFDVEAAPWFVVGESAGIERAVTNLLDNAAKWSPAGGTVTVRLADGTLTVDDSGPGIAEHDLPHVFDRFYRSEESRSMPGSGLGLSIVHQVAERHSGTVEVRRSPAGGARLILSLPGSPHPVPEWTPA